MSDERTPEIVLKELLDEAATLEHCLLNTYLYAASSLKSTPAEFATISGKPNRRRGIQFERVRLWKQSILNVAHEEMLHLHYVQCMLRALGHTPCFLLPQRDKKTGSWVLANWKAKIGGQPANDGTGMQVPVEEFSMEAIRYFILYESTDSLQDGDPFGKKTSQLFTDLFTVELELYFENALFNISDEDKRRALKQQLIEIYTTLTPVAPEETLIAKLEKIERSGLPPQEELHFQSIGDLYLKGIQPLIEQAFHFGQVKQNNRDLADELLDPNFAQEGFLPIGPIYRSKNFQDNSQNSLKNYKSVQDVIREIVEEGEGFSLFTQKAKAFLQKIAEIGTRAYVEALKQDKQSQSSTPEWLADCQNIRTAHLYKFATIKAEFEMENALAEQVNVEFLPVRDQLNDAENVPLANMAKELPAYFNACYLVLIMWLGRIYEVREWKSDTPRRKAIESLASWPMMSMAIRPFLELASFLPVDLTQLFLITPESIPTLPVYCHQLFELYMNKERSEKINDQMDYLALKILSQVGVWANEKYQNLQGLDVADEQFEMVLRRLKGLSNLGEFEKQFPFRMYGGYSSTMPNDYFAETVDAPDQFEEDPSFSVQTGSVQPAFADTLAIRLRFSGWGRVQLSTDPDPPTDESGCTGTNMLHPDDGGMILNRALVWQNNDPPSTINRQPETDLPRLGINCVDATLLVTQAATASFKAIGNLASKGAVQTSGVQQYLSVDGFHELATLPVDALSGKNLIQVNLLEKSGQKPYLVGDNHLMWKDGEPVDPFILSLQKGASSSISREIYSEGLTIREMSPVQRIKTIRWPVGFDSFRNLPPWARANMTKTQSQLLTQPGFPITYLEQRAATLQTYLETVIKDNTSGQEEIDRIAATVERLRLTVDPRGTTVAWLNFLLHYGHSVSGQINAANPENLFSGFADLAGLKLSLAAVPNRNAPNSRWIVKYTKGIMDVDAISDFVFGELYIPVTANATEATSFKKAWNFSADMLEVLRGYALNFTKPFWGTYSVDGKKRTGEVSGWQTTETLLKNSDAGYSYTIEGIDHSSEFSGTFTLSGKNTAELVFAITFKVEDSTAIVATCNYIGTLIYEMNKVLNSQFLPR